MKDSVKRSGTLSKRLRGLVKKVSIRSSVIFTALKLEGYVLSLNILCVRVYVCMCAGFQSQGSELSSRTNAKVFIVVETENGRLLTYSSHPSWSDKSLRELTAGGKSSKSRAPLSERVPNEGPVPAADIGRSGSYG